MEVRIHKEVRLIFRPRCMKSSAYESVMMMMLEGISSLPTTLNNPNGNKFQTKVHLCYLENYVSVTTASLDKCGKLQFASIHMLLNRCSPRTNISVVFSSPHVRRIMTHIVPDKGWIAIRFRRSLRVTWSILNRTIILWYAPFWQLVNERWQAAGAIVMCITSVTISQFSSSLTNDNYNFV